MPFAYNGYCFETPEKALDAFRQDFPILSDVASLSLASSSVTGSGLISFTVNHRVWTSTTVTARTGTVQLSSCTDSMGVPPSPFVFSSEDATAVGIAIATLWLSVGVLKFLWDRHFH